VEGAAAFTIKVDATKAQALLNESGRSDFGATQSINGADVSVNIPASVTVSFGTCPDPVAQDSAKSLNGNARPAGSIRLRDPGGAAHPDRLCTPELNIAQLAQIGLEFPA